jgi:hypothetical protein
VWRACTALDILCVALACRFRILNSTIGTLVRSTPVPLRRPSSRLPIEGRRISPQVHPGMGEDCNDGT